jgi:RNA-binding protein
MSEDIDWQDRVATVDLEALELQCAPLTKGAAIALASPALVGKSRRHLRSMGNTLKALVHIGHSGCTGAVARSVDDALEQHELVKIKVLDTCPQSMGTVAVWCHRVLDAQVAQWLGHTLLVYRARVTGPIIQLPRS